MVTTYYHTVDGRVWGQSTSSSLFWVRSLGMEQVFLVVPGSLGLREGFVDELVELRIDAAQRSAERERQDGGVAGEHRHGGTEHPGFQTGEQTGDFPAVRRQEVAMRLG